MKFVFMPVSIVAGLVAGQISKRLFDFAWGALKDEEAPRPKHRHIPYGELVVALLVEGAIARIVRGFVDHGTRQGWARLTGVWPGEEAPEDEK